MAARPGAVALLVPAVVLVASGVALWIDPPAAVRVLPCEPSLLGGRFMACWLAFLAVMAVWAGLRPAEARLPFLALTVYPVGALIAGVRSIADLSPSTAQWGYLVVLGT